MLFKVSDAFHRLGLLAGTLNLQTSFAFAVQGHLTQGILVQGPIIPVTINESSPRTAFPSIRYVLWGKPHRTPSDLSVPLITDKWDCAGLLSEPSPLVDLLLASRNISILPRILFWIFESFHLLYASNI